MQLRLRKNTNTNCDGHIFCSNCSSALVIDLSPWDIYANPNMDLEWELTWHEFHSVRFLFPELIKLFWNDEFDFTCPSCGIKDHNCIHAFDKGILDLKHIQASLETEKKTNFVCDHCEGLFSSIQHVIKIDNKYICKDCISFT